MNLNISPVGRGRSFKPTSVHWLKHTSCCKLGSDVDMLIPLLVKVWHASTSPAAHTPGPDNVQTRNIHRAGGDQRAEEQWRGAAGAETTVYIQTDAHPVVPLPLSDGSSGQSSERLCVRSQTNNATAALHSEEVGGGALRCKTYGADEGEQTCMPHVSEPWHHSHHTRH